MRFFLRCLAAVSIAVFFSTRANADPPLETVFLKNGGIVRGLVVELLPGDHVTVQLPSGEVTRVDWPEIDHVDRPPPPAPVPLTAPATGPKALIHIQSPRHVTLDRKNPGEDQPWVTACESPCDVELPVDNEYRIVGSGIRPSNEFRLDAKPGQRVVLEVSPGSKAVRATGIVIGSLGVTALVTGLYLWASMLPALNDSACNRPSSGCDTVRAIGRDGLIIAGTGAALALVGGVLFLTSNRSGTSQTDEPPRALSAAPFFFTF